MLCHCNTLTLKPGDFQDCSETTKAVDKIEGNVKVVKMKIKTEETLRKKDLDKYYQTLVDQINAELANVKKKVTFITSTELG